MLHIVDLLTSFVYVLLRQLKMCSDGYCGTGLVDLNCGDLSELVEKSTESLEIDKYIFLN